MSDFSFSKEWSRVVQAARNNGHYFSVHNKNGGFLSNEYSFFLDEVSKEMKKEIFDNNSAWCVNYETERFTFEFIGSTLDYVLCKLVERLKKEGILEAKDKEVT